MLLFWSRSAQPSRSYFPSCLTDGSPRSSSDLLSSSLVFIVTLFLDDYSKSNFPSPFLLSWTNYSKSNFPFLRLPSRTNHSKAHFILSLFLDKIFFSPNSIFSFSKTFSFLVLAANSLQLFRNILRQFPFCLSRKCKFPT